VIDRLRELLERPLDPSAARAVLALAAAIFLGFALLVLAAKGEQPDRSIRRQGNHPTVSLPPSAPTTQPASTRNGSSRGRQDPQDREGSAAARRAARAIRSHRALQHLPYRDSHLKVDLVGARGLRAVVRVSAPSARAARSGWRRFLRRYRDSGAAYLVLFNPGKAGSHG